MYCPHCAAQNIDDAKFCRACGSDLEIISLALTDPSGLRAKIGKNKEEPPKKPKNRLETRIEGVRNTIQGAFMLLATLVIGVALALFVPSDIPWIFIWMVFFGWLAVWGAFSVAGGLGGLVESRMMLRQGEPVADEIAAANTAELLSAAREMQTISNGSAASETSPHLSITEHTTELFSKSPREDA